MMITKIYSLTQKKLLFISVRRPVAGIPETIHIFTQELFSSMPNYAGQTRILAAVDCIIFGFDGESLKVLLVKRGIEPEKNKWSLIGGFLAKSESLEQAATRVLKKFTGIEGLYMHPLRTFSDPERDPLERTISTAFTSLIDIHQYEKQIIRDYHAEWFPVGKKPKLIFDHDSMLKMARRNSVSRPPPTPFYSNCSLKNLPYRNCKTCMKVFMKSNSTTVTLVVNFCQPNFLSNSVKKISQAPKKEHFTSNSTGENIKRGSGPS